MPLLLLYEARIKKVSKNLLKSLNLSLINLEKLDLDKF